MKSISVLIIEDQKSMALLLKARIEEIADFEVKVAHTMSDAKSLLEEDDSITLCVSDLNLPDAPNAEIVDLLRNYQVTTVVLTGSYSENVRKRVFDAHVADYIVKDGLASIEYAVSSVVTLMSNSEREIWILSQNHRLTQKTKSYLKLQRYRIKIFDNFDDVVKLMDTQLPNLIVLDTMEDHTKLSVYEFLNTVRARYNDSELPILAFTYPEEESFSIKLLKYGVSDLISINYYAEELFLRIKKAIEHSTAYKQIQKVSHCDPLTDLYNRRYFFNEGSKLWQNAVNREHLFVLIIDIDNFKQVNDRYGHPKGDEGIQFTSAYLCAVFSSYLVARFGGEEFVVLGETAQRDEMIALCETLRSSIESQSEASIDVYLTVSGGISFGAASLETAIAEADDLLYKAKETGRNQILNV